MTFPRDIVSVSATHCSRRFSDCLREAIRHPVQILSHRKSVAFLLSSERFEQLVEAERKLQEMRAVQAEAEGYLSAAETAHVMGWPTEEETPDVTVHEAD